ncbi:hypothetical protein ACOSQ4_022537 [Xanthoceras sorbifolium]
MVAVRARGWGCGGGQDGAVRSWRRGAGVGARSQGRRGTIAGAQGHSRRGAGVGHRGAGAVRSAEWESRDGEERRWEGEKKMKCCS